MINIKIFDQNLLKIDKMSYKSIDIGYIGYISIKVIGHCQSVNSANPFYFIISEVDGCI